MVDKFLYDAVADFLNVTCCGINNPFAFNVFDIAIFVGAIGLAFVPENGNAQAQKGLVTTALPGLRLCPR